jgi:hypothetical protein
MEPPVSVMLPPIWALGFANAALLYGLAAASVPIILHLLNRRRFREVSWAAMRFLMAAIKKNQRRVRIEQWLLLAIRTLIILLVVMAMAKPFLESFGMVIAGRTIHRVLVLDASMSMGYTSTPGGTSRFDQAKAEAAQLVKESRSGDYISVILMGQPPRVIIGDPSPNLKEVGKEIGELTMTHGGVDLAATFEAVDRVMDVSSIPQKEVIFLTDLQAASWRLSEMTEGFKRVLARIAARQPRSVLIDLGKTGGENWAVTDLKLDTPVVTVGSRVLVRGVLRNFGATPAEGIRARLTVDNRLGPEAPEDLSPGDDHPVVFTEVFPTAGDHVLELSVDDDPLLLDNKRWLVVPVRESLNVLLVDGHFKSEPYQAETDYLAQALSPTESSPGQAGSGPIRVEVVSESQLSRRELNPYDAVVLCNVAQFSQPEVTALEDFLKQGGGVVIFGGDQVVAENYNRLLYADGNGLLPASVGPSIGDAAKREAAIAFDPRGYRHPLVSDYQSESGPVTAGLTQAITWQFHKLTIPKGSKAEVALAFETGDPAIIEAPRHRGTVIVVATSADAGWTSWPIHKSYPPVMQQIILRASAGRLSERNIRVGQPYDHSFPESGTAAPVTVLTPKGLSVTSKLQQEGGVSQFHFEQTDLSGQYQVRIGPPLSVDSSFAANTDPAESDLAKLDEAALRSQIPGWSFNYFDVANWKDLTGDAASVGRRGELHRPMLYAVLAFLLLESFLAWKFGHNS